MSGRTFTQSPTLASPPRATRRPPKRRLTEQDGGVRMHPKPRKRGARGAQAPRSTTQRSEEWAEKARARPVVELETEVAAPKLHSLMRSSDVVWCCLCGSFGTHRGRGLARSCPGPIPPGKAGGRAQQLKKLNAGVHPKDGHYIGAAMPQHRWTRSENDLVNRVVYHIEQDRTGYNDDNCDPTSSRPASHSGGVSQLDKLKQRVLTMSNKGGAAPKTGRSRLLVDSANECAAQDANRKRPAHTSPGQLHGTQHARRRVTLPEEQSGTTAPSQSEQEVVTTNVSSTTDAGGNYEGTGSCGGERTSRRATQADQQLHTTTTTASTGGPAESRAAQPAAAEVDGNQSTGKSVTKGSSTNTNLTAAGSVNAGQCPRGVVRHSTAKDHGSHKRTRWHGSGSDPAAGSRGVGPQTFGASGATGDMASSRESAADTATHVCAGVLPSDGQLSRGVARPSTADDHGRYKRARGRQGLFYCHHS